MRSRNRFLVEQFVKQLTHGTPTNFPGLKVHYKLSSVLVKSFGLFGKVDFESRKTKKVKPEEEQKASEKLKQ